jgi:hypothetical protein
MTNDRTASEKPMVGRILEGAAHILHRESDANDRVQPVPGGESSIAPHDSGWAELLSRDATIRYGRGHLMIWPGATPDPTATGAARVHPDAVFPMGDQAPGLRGELRSFTADGDLLPPSGGPFSIRPELDNGTVYPVVIPGPIVIELNGALPLRWMDGELPSAMREMGGE